MSEYQYYEFQALDRPLTAEDRAELRTLSSRARITSHSFTNSYDWGDFRGQPDKLVARWFDLHLYLANWGTRRLMIRLPKRLLPVDDLKSAIQGIENFELTMSGENYILDICREEIEPDYDWDDGAGRLTALAPLRNDILGGDLRLFYLLWLMAIEDGIIEDEAEEPFPWTGAMTPALDAFIHFFEIDSDLIAAAIGQPNASANDGRTADGVHRIIAGIAEDQKTELLVRLALGDPHVGNEVRAHIRRLEKSTSPKPALRTAGELEALSESIASARERLENERCEAERQRIAAQERKAYQTHLKALRKRGGAVWAEIETEIARRNPAGYDKATKYLNDLKFIADEDGTIDDFHDRLADIRERHGGKGRFIERLIDL